jgi:hypothetical protein
MEVQAMSDVVHFTPKRNPEQQAHRDRADEVAVALLRMAFRHLVAHWDEKTEDFDIPSLRKKVAAVLRLELAHAAKGNLRT